ncbi:MAG: vanadium-dependent haloperoxidase [Betaproteobacteria bacterium]|nr:vanadium-dependent haloperoxidase [Betaproteobacteria bacterium]
MDSILYWNNAALEANRVSHSNGADEEIGPTLSSRALAIVHLAMYDAFAGVTANPAVLPPYLAGLPLPAAGAAIDAAVAAAAYDTLRALFPAQQAFFDAQLAAAALPAAGLAQGTAYGQQVAAAILADRNADPGASDAGYVPPVHAAAHERDPDNAQKFHAPFYGALSKCFAASARHGLDIPPLPGDAQYLSALKEVRAKGIATELMGTLPNGYPRRTPNEKVIGVYWGYDGAKDLGTPPRLYNQIVRTLAIARGNTPAQNARLFALVNVAMADAGILAWDQKYFHNLWRPVVGIRANDPSMGPLAVGNNLLNADCDSGWLPLGAPKSNEPGVKNFTPPFPAYPSGHATFGAAALHITRLFYGVPRGDTDADNLFDGLTFVSDEMNGVTTDNKGAVRPRHVRNFPGGLWQMIEENGRSRVYLGVHWVFDAFAVDNNNVLDLTRNVGGVALGLKIAEDIFGASRESGMRKSTVGPRL